MNPIIDLKIEEWYDIGYVVALGGTYDSVESSENWMNWRLYNIFGTAEKTNAIIYQKLNVHGYTDETTQNIKEAFAMAEGFIKWDGCMQWDFKEMLHVDDRQSIRHLGEALERIRDVMRNCGHEDQIEPR